ncbi:hypothetical protein SPAN111604_14580 [Sphingomonas antarctica]|uniref:hypothetical protein n=1 Tax=Sphingomonas antarctica TaxID=2040274 RepID=UPI0039E9582E
MSTNLIVSAFYIFALVAVASALMAWMLLYLRKRGKRVPLAGRRDETIVQRRDENPTPTDPM